jgi:serine/threonine kinase 16
MKEVEAYKLFSSSPGIIHSVDYAIASERNDPSSKTVYVLLPYYQRGNLQDMINANLVNHTRFPERRLMELFLGICRALRDMHVYKGSGGGERMRVGDGVDENVQVAKGRKRGAAGADEEDEREQARPLMAGEEGVDVTGGKSRSYAHRDIKPGMCPHSTAQTSCFLTDDANMP